MLAAEPLTLADLQAQAEAPRLPGVVQKLRDSHHGLARLLAEGRKHVEVCAITGYSTEHISRLESDPAFQELVVHYRTTVNAEYASVHQRLTDLGLDTIQELHQRLVEKPEEFTPTQLESIAKLALDRAGFGPTKTVNQTQLTAQVTAEDLARIRSQTQRGEVRRIDQQTQTTIIEAEAAVVVEAAPSGDRANPSPLSSRSADSDPEDAPQPRGKERYLI